MPEERLQKILARAGLASRRKAEGLILAGRVTVDGRVAHLGERADPARQRVLLDGKKLRAEPPVAYLVNKPRGVAMHAEGAQPCVTGLVPDRRKLQAGGRLGLQDEGVVVVTNDGALAERVTHARYGLARTYRASVSGRPAREEMELLKRGVTLEGRRVRAERVRFKHAGRKRSVLRLEVRGLGGRRVRELLAAAGLQVTRLVCASIGPVRLAGLPTGACRRLAPAEVAALTRAAPRGATPTPRPERPGRPGRPKHPKRRR